MRPPSLPSSFTTAQAAALGLGDKRLRRLVTAGKIVRVRRGIYGVTGPTSALDRDGVYRQLVRSSLSADGESERGLVASHLSAAAVFHLPLPLGPLDVVHLTRLGCTDQGWRAPGLWVHHTDSVPVDPTLVDGVPTTPADRTVADCLRMFSPRVSVPIADAALRRKLATPRQVADELARHRHWHGRVMNADRALPVIDGRRESWLESYAAVRFAEWEIDPPVPQLIVLDEDGRFVARADAGWQADATVLGLDGQGKYALPQADGSVDPDRVWRAEKTRYDEMGNLGLERVRFGLADLVSGGNTVQRRVRDRRRTGSRSRFTGSFLEVPPLTIPWIRDPR